MSRKNKLSSFLHLISTITFWIILIFFVSNISIQLLFTDSEIKTSKNSKISVPKGYPIPVQVNLSLSKYGNIYESNKGIASVPDNEPIDDTVQKIINHHTKKTRIGSEFKLIDSVENDNFQFTNKIFPGKTHIMIIPKKTFLVFLLFINKHYKILITLIILFYLKGIFKNLKEELSFNPYISSRTKLIGLLIILKELLSLILTFGISKYYSVISINSETNFRYAFNLNFYPTLEFSFSLFITGLSLLIISSLLQQANTLQTENNLTI